VESQNPTRFLTFHAKWSIFSALVNQTFLNNQIEKMVPKPTRFLTFHANNQIEKLTRILTFHAKWSTLLALEILIFLTLKSPAVD